jgi:hypothetical protein
VFAAATGRRAKLDLDTDRYFEIADDPDLSYGDKLAAYRGLADAHFESERYRDFWDSGGLGDRLDEVVLDWVSGPDFDTLLTDTVKSTYPAHEHDQFIAHLRGLTGLWASDERTRLGAR